MINARRPVVVGVADKQPAALSFAVEEARRLRTDLLVMHSYAIPAQVATFYAGTDFLSELKEGGRVVMADARRFVEQEGPDVHADYRVSHVAPVPMLLKAAEQAQLVVLGADEVTWLERVTGGEVASHIAEKAACPVVIVPESGRPRHDDHAVVVTLDGDTAAAGPLHFAFERADSTGVVLHVLHAVPPATSAVDADEHRANVAEVVAGWSGRYPSVRVLTSTTRNDPAEACITATRHASLVVVGRPHGVPRPFAISRPVATTVLRGAHCPVAVVPLVMSSR